MNDIMDKDRKHIEYEIVKTILSALNYGDISFQEAQKAAKYFLLHFPQDMDTKVFLLDINSKWKLFDLLIERFTKQSQFSAEDSAKLEKVKQQLSQLTQTSL